jgi:hypothetical protein
MCNPAKARRKARDGWIREPPERNGMANAGETAAPQTNPNENPARPKGRPPTPMHLAIIGSGPSCIYLLKHLLDAAEAGDRPPESVAIFEKDPIAGMGMPYSPLNTDRYHAANIASREIPALPQAFADWLRRQDPEHLRELGVETAKIKEDAIYSRLALGGYFQSQFRSLIAGLAARGISVREYCDCEIIDLRDDPGGKSVSVNTAAGVIHKFDRVLIASGHFWDRSEDRPGSGYFASPWPIDKLLPGDGEIYNFAVGILGSSLSAFDVVTSLAHRHGDFVRNSGGLRYLPRPGTEDFRIVMHGSDGLLPHLRFHVDQPLRDVYRHVTREELLSLADARGFLRLATYFDRVCRPALAEAFRKDGMEDMVERLAEPSFGLPDFVKEMTRRHDYADAFAGLPKELEEARESLRKRRPIHWKETLDDLAYTLGFHAERLPAEDHLLLQSEVLPFLLNVAAAMPLESAEKLLAMREAGKVELVAGEVRVVGKREGWTTIRIENETALQYRFFVDCGGDKSLNPEGYPFPTLAKEGSVRKARVRFARPEEAREILPEEKRGRLFHEGNETLFHPGGIEVDFFFRVVGDDDNPNPRIHDIAFPHISGIRPWAYGLQACNDNAAILTGHLTKPAVRPDEEIEA